jgi:hypothetical protein
MNRKWLAALSAFMIGACAVASGAFGQSASESPASRPRSVPRDGSRDFDFEIGKWSVRNARLVHTSSGDEWIHFNGTSLARKVWGGRADLLELESDAPTGHSEGLILRLYNPESRQWCISFASSSDGALGTPSIGEFTNGRGEFYAQESIGGKMVLTRSVISGITATSYRLEQATSDDGGRTWQVNWISEHTRIP